MDEMNIRSKFLKGILSAIIKKNIKANMGFDADVDLRDVTITIKDGRLRLDGGCTIETDQMNLLSILKL